MSMDELYDELAEAAVLADRERMRLMVFRVGGFFVLLMILRPLPLSSWWWWIALGCYPIYLLWVESRLMFVGRRPIGDALEAEAKRRGLEDVGALREVLSEEELDDLLAFGGGRYQPAFQWWLGRRGARESEVE